MKASPKDVLRASRAVGVILLIVGVVAGNVFVTNRLLEQNRDALTITPTTPTPVKGDKGDKGDSPSAEEVKQAVADYCASSGLCEGPTPSASIVYAAVSRYCLDNGCRGEPGASGVNGKDGRDAPAVTDIQIQSQVAAYCKEFGCTGPAGVNGADGSSGTNGRSPEMTCVQRDGGSQYVAWKYADEADSAYRDIYQVPALSPCSDPVDLR